MTTTLCSAGGSVISPPSVRGHRRGLVHPQLRSLDEPTGPGSRVDGRDPTLRPIELVAVAGAVVTGLVLRFWTSSHLWLDEALSVDIARLPLGDIPRALRHDGHPPLYYFLLHGWMSVFGEGDTAVRSLS